MNGTTTTNGALILQYTCANIESQLFTLSLESDVSSVQKPNLDNEHFTIYPNPGKSEDLIFDLKNLNNPFELYIIDISGRIIYSEKIIDNLLLRPGVDLPEGIYIAEVKDEGNVMLKKFIVK